MTDMDESFTKELLSGLGLMVLGILLLPIAFILELVVKVWEAGHNEKI